MYVYQSMHDIVYYNFVMLLHLFSCMQVIELIKRDILPVSKQTPDEFLNRLTSILNRGSIHSATDNIDGMHLSLSLMGCSTHF